MPDLGRGMKPTKAQRRVLEQMAAGEVLHYSGYMIATFRLGHARVRSDLATTLRNRRWIACVRQSAGGIFDYGITDAGRAALGSQGNV